MRRTHLVTGALCALALSLLAGLAVATAVPVDAGQGEAATLAGNVGVDRPGVDARTAARDDAPSNTSVRIRAVYPNPVAHRDAGEFVVLEAPGGRWPANATLSDGEATVPIPPDTNGTDAAEITLSADPDLTKRLRSGSVRAFGGNVRFADAGERIVVRQDGRVLDRFTYEDAPEGRVATVSDGRRVWRPLGATDRPVVTDGSGTVEAFVLPDEPDRAVEFVASAEDRILLAGYTFSSERVADELVAAKRRGVAVRVLVDGNPVGGTTEREAETLDRLARANVSVETFDTERARYATHHPKYAVVDDRALVTSENWKPAGLGGRSSRGWAVVTDQDAIVSGLAETFAADAGWADTAAWDPSDPGPVVKADPPANGTFPSRFQAEELPVERTRLAVSPDNAHGELRALIDGAKESIRIQQAGIGDRDYELLRAAVDAARRGVDVRILLDGSWYAEEENEAVAEWANEVAEREDLPLDAKVSASDDSYEKIHAKGMVVDGRHAVVGSLNWNEHASHRNREVVLILTGDAVGDYYASVFDADWGEDPEGGLPWGLFVVGGVVVLIAVGVALTLRVEPTTNG